LSNNDRFEPLDLEEIEEEEIIDDELLEPEEEPAEILFDNGKGYVTSEEADRISQQGFYGTRLDDGRLELEPVEVLHLLERKRIIAKNPEKVLLTDKEIVNQLLPNNPDLWIMYLVFRDLRSRGYAVRQGFGKGIGFRVYARGEKPGVSSANQLVYVLKEGIPISLNDLDLVTQTAATARKNLVFALVDQNGEVNYYRVARAVLPERGGELIG
jgi:tRNA-intron endonuclease